MNRVLVPKVLRGTACPNPLQSNQLRVPRCCNVGARIGSFPFMVYLKGWRAIAQPKSGFSSALSMWQRGGGAHMDLLSNSCWAGRKQCSDDEGGTGVALRAAQARILLIAARRQEVPHLRFHNVNVTSKPSADAPGYRCR